MKQTYKLLIIGIITIFSSVSILAQVSFNNSSFEGTTGTNVIPSPWSICASSTVDTCPGPFSVNFAASEGNTYIGLWSGSSTTPTFPGESFSQIAPCAVTTGKQYTFNLDIAWDLDGGATYTQGGTLQIWGGMASCAKSQLLWQGAPTAPQIWQTKTVNFTPTSDWTYFTISALSENNKYVLLDNITPISRAGATLSTSNATCGGLGNDGSATVNAPADGTPWQYSWSPGGQTTPTISGLSEGIYTCTISDPSETCPIPIVIKAAIQGPPAITASATNTFICPGENSQLETTVPSFTIPNCTYKVYMFDGFGDGWSTPSNVKVYKNTVLIGTFTCTGSASINSFTVAQGDALEFSYTSASSYNNEQRFEVRDASSAILYNSGLNPTTGVKYNTVANCGVTPATYSYSWTPTTGLSNPAIANPVATPTATTTYTVSVESSTNPGCASTKDVTISVGGATSIVTTMVNETCDASNGSIILGSVTGGVAPYTYAFNGSGHSTTTTYTNLPAGCYPVDVKDANGCVFNTVVCIMNNTPTAIATTVVNETCGNANGCITITSVIGGIPPGTFSFAGSAYTSITTYCGLAAGTYPITVKDANGCTYSTSITVINDSSPTANISYAGTPFSSSDASQQPVTLMGTGAYTGGSYSAAPAGLALDTTTGSVNPGASVPSCYTVTYFIPASGGCPAVTASTNLCIAVLGVESFVNNLFSAYPNPTTGIITIALKDRAALIDTIMVTDVLGKTVQSNTINTSSTTIDLSQLTKGLYFVKIQAEGQVKTLKVVKE